MAIVPADVAKFASVAEYVREATLLAREGEPDRALAVIRRMAAEFPENPDVWFNQGLFFQQNGFLGEAVESYGKALAIKPDHYHSMANLAQVYYRCGDLDRCIALYRRCVDAFPNAVEPKLALCSLLQSSGDAEGSLKLLLSFSDGRLSRKSGLATSAAKLFFNAQLDERALSLLKEGWRPGGEDPIAYRMRSLIFIRRQQFDRARLEMESCPSSVREDPSMRDLAAWIDATIPAAVAGSRFSILTHRQAPRYHSIATASAERWKNYSRVDDISRGPGSIAGDIRRQYAALQDTPNFAIWVIRDAARADENEVAGFVKLSSISWRERCAEISLVLAPATRSGVGARAMAFGMFVAFNRFGLRKLDGYVFDSNRYSAMLAAKLGMEPDYSTEIRVDGRDGSAVERLHHYSIHPAHLDASPILARISSRIRKW